MSKKNYLLSLMTTMMVAMLSVGFVSCGDDDDIVSPDSGQPINPSTPVNDPEGTIALSMRNADNGKTYLDNIYIDKENFKGASFASIGAVSGLGNVSTIPTSGWAEQMSVIAGNGYVAYSNNQFYRIYVVSDIAGTSGGVIGADIKYQKPFKGVDEAIQLPKTEVTFNANAGSTEIIFKNQNIVVYSVGSDQNWCQVQNCSTNDKYFLYNGVHISCLQNSSSLSREATITIETAYDKKVTIKVTQAGQAPFLSLSSENIQTTSVEQTSTIPFTTNVNISDLQITGATSWCRAEIITTNNAPMSAVRFIEDQPVGATRAADGTSQTYSLKLQLSENTSEDDRSTNIIIKSSRYNIQKTLNVVQKGVTFEVSQDLVMFDRNNSNATITVTTTASTWSANSSADWCTFTTNGNMLTIRAKASTVEREAKITFPGFRQEIVVRQSKYAVGDEYNEGNVTGTVGYIGSGKAGEDFRIIYKCVGKGFWSTEQVLTGANDAYDGRNNMNVIKQIANWQELYPAFALCDELNANGVTGWYLPSYQETIKFRNKVPSSNREFWSSTESNVISACYSGSTSSGGNKTTYNLYVVSVHRF
ncbi:MAG: DUF5036 family protein [Bacteroidaceae bacterium]|nr:DUF5036 family protein [Bacteroidaceae bacterium]